MSFNNYFRAGLFAILFSSCALAIQLPFETAAVGRVQGDTLQELQNSLDVPSVSVANADYYNTNFIQNDDATKVLNAAYGPNNVQKGFWSWSFDGLRSAKIAKNRLLIIQSRGVVKDSILRAFDGFTNPAQTGPLDSSQINQSMPLYNVQLDGAIEGGNLVISNVDYAGTYLPSMSKNSSFSSQLAGKAGALIAANGLSNQKFVTAFLCSLALQDKSFGTVQSPNYYKFNSLGDRFRNAKNNLAQFGSGDDAAAASDFSLYGAPFIKVEGNKYSGDFLKSVCGDLANYNTYPSIQSVSAQSEGEAIYTKNVSLDFSAYSVLSDNGFQLIDVNGAVQRLSDSQPVLPQAVTQIELPLGTIIRDVNVISKSNPATFSVGALPSWSGDGFTERMCDSNSEDVSVDFSTLYTESKQIISAKIVPVEIIDCQSGSFRLYRNFEIEASYTPYSPVLIKSVDAAKQATLGEIVDVNILLDNITSQNVSGTIKILDGNAVIAENSVSVSAGTAGSQTLSFQSGDKEGLYDYTVEFDHNGVAKANSNFKVDVQVLNVGLEFVGSKKFYDDFESVQFEKKWEPQQITLTGNGKSFSAYQNAGLLSVLARTSTYAQTQDDYGFAEGHVVGKEGLAVFGDEFNGDVSSSLGLSYTPNGNGNFPLATVNKSYALQSPRIFRRPETGTVPLKVHVDSDTWLGGTVSLITQFGNLRYAYYLNDGNRVEWSGANIYNAGGAPNSHDSYSASHYVNAYTVEFGIPVSSLNDGSNEILFVAEEPSGERRTEIMRFKIYAEPIDCHGTQLPEFKESGYCAGDIRFSIHELPLVISLSGGSKVYKLGGSELVVLDENSLSGDYALEKENNSTIKWKKGVSAWNYIDVSDWNTERLGFDFYAKSSSSYTASTTALNLQSLAAVSIIDGNHSSPIAASSLTYSQREEPLYYTDASIDVLEIMQPYPSSARGTTYLKATFENKSDDDISLVGKYVVVDENGSVGYGEFTQDVPIGLSEKEISIAGLYGPQKAYDSGLAISYDNRSKVANASFSGNQPPAILAPSYIQVYADNNAVLDYNVFDSDNDSVDFNISGPFSVSDNVWLTDGNDVGTTESVITASDGFETVQKTITIDVEPARVLCSVDEDCGSVVITEGRICSAGSLLAQEVHPVCNNPSTTISSCSYVDVNRVYGYCGLKETLSDGNASLVLRFDSNGDKEYSIELPRKTVIKNAYLSVSGNSPQSMCFNAVSSYDQQDSNTVKYNFANGTSFVGLPLGDHILIASREQNSDFLDGFYDIVFTSETPGIASWMDTVVACPQKAAGFRYLEMHVQCDNDVVGFSSNFAPLCNQSPVWASTGILDPTSTSSMQDFCAWSPGEKTIGSSHNSLGSYSSYYGQYVGIYDRRPAFRAYVRQFQSGRELYLGEVPYEVKQVAFDANHDLRSQSISYYVTTDGATWNEISSGSSVDFNASQTREAFNWKAVLFTQEPQKTPRIHSADVCIETFGSPVSPQATIGSTQFDLPDDGNSFDTEIDITGALNAYLSSLPPSDDNVLVPVKFSSDSEGIFSLDSISYEFDVNDNTSPVIQDIESQFVTAGQQFALQVIAGDSEGGPVSYSDDTALFDINSSTGLIYFTAQSANIGVHEITITVSDGNLFSSKSFNLTIAGPQEPQVNYVIGGSAGKAFGQDYNVNYSISSAQGNKLIGQDYNVILGVQ